MVQIDAASGSTVQSRARNRQLEILQAASAVFRRRGLHATGMRDIAAELGMHVGNLYYYFENKQEILAFCQEQTLKDLLSLVESVGSQTIRADTKLFRVVRGHVTQLNEETPGSLAHLEIEALDQPWRKRIQQRRDRYEAGLRAILEEGIEDGIFRTVDPKVATMALLGAANWTVKWFQPEGEMSSSEIGGQFAELFVRGLLAPGIRPRLAAVNEAKPRQRTSGESSTLRKGRRK